MKRLLEFCKTVLIVVLLCSLSLLAVASVPTDTLREIPWLSSVLQPVAPLLGLPQAELTYVAEAPAVLDAAQPVAISVRNSAGRSTAQWDVSALDSRFDTLGSFLGQALDTAEIFTKVSQKQLQTALSANSVYFAYPTALPAGLFASWLGASLEAAVPDSFGCLLSVQSDGVDLYLIGDTAYVASTPLDAAELNGLLEAFRPDGSLFAFEAGSHLWPLCLLPGDRVAVPGAAVHNPVTSRYVENLATGLGFNPYGESRYTDTDGAIHFTEANCTLKIASGGRVQLTAAETDRFSAPGPDPAALVETARQLADLTVGGTAGHARVYLSGVSRTGTRTVCTFEYLVSGIPVALDRASAASVVFEGTAVVQLTAQVCGFTEEDRTLYPLPAVQAAALLDKGDTLELQYCPTADGLLDVGWKE